MSDRPGPPDAATAVASPRGPGHDAQAPVAGDRWSRRPAGRPSLGLLAILVATALLFLFSLAFQPESLSRSSFLGMLPFASVLAIVAVGQTLVVQQGGIDLSVPGMISISVVIATHEPNGDNHRLPAAILLAYGVALAAGLLNGTIVSRIRMSAIVATLGTNALLYAGVLAISGGTPRITTSVLRQIAAGDFLSVPHAVFFAVLITAAVGFAIKQSVVGRRFEAVGANPAAARSTGLAVQRHQLAAYVWASVLYCTGGLLLAGIVTAPSAFQGDAYLLPSVAAVVLGGTSLLGGKGSPVASAVAALFLSQLDQFVLTLGVNAAVKNLVEAAALAAGVAVYTVNWPRVRDWIRRARSRGPGTGMSTTSS